MYFAYGADGTILSMGRIIWQGVEYVLRSMWDTAQRGDAILREVREGYRGGRGGGP